MFCQIFKTGSCTPSSPTSCCRCESDRQQAETGRATSDCPNDCLRSVNIAGIRHLWLVRRTFYANILLFKRSPYFLEPAEDKHAMMPSYLGMQQLTGSLSELSSLQGSRSVLMNVWKMHAVLSTTKELTEFYVLLSKTFEIGKANVKRRLRFRCCGSCVW